MWIADETHLDHNLNAYVQWWFERFKRNTYRSFPLWVPDHPIQTNPEPGER